MEKNMILKSNKTISILVLLIIFVDFAVAKKRGVYATKNIQGQNYYLNRCSKCHGDGNMGGNIASVTEWKMFFENDGKELLFYHDDKNIKKYIKSEKFKKESKNMLKFLQEFAYDSEFIPTCN